MQVGGNEAAELVVVFSSSGSRTRSRSLIVRPGVMTRNRLAKRASFGWATLLSVCQAMSIAITTVLPEPVAIFSATRCRPRLHAVFVSLSWLRIQASPAFCADSAR